MKTKDINTLAQLREAKKELKQQMAAADQNAQDNFLFSSLNKLFSKVEKSNEIQTSPVGSGVSGALNFLSNQAENRLNMGKTGKTILSIAVAVVTPIIAKKVQEYIQDKF